MEDKKSRQDWLKAGLQQLAVEGPGGLRIMPIAEKLGVTKGSFYWHFKNLKAFETAVIEEWEQSHTQKIIDAVELVQGDAQSRLLNLFARTLDSDFRLARAIRAWSLTDEGVRDIVKRVDKKRIEYVAKLLQELGKPKGEAAALGRFIYCAAIGYAHLQAAPATAAELAVIVATFAKTSS